jgi:hypothetical protein
MAVRSLHDRDFCPDAVEPHDAIDPPALDRPLALQLESELDEELSRGREVVNDDAHVVHSLDSHMSDGIRPTTAHPTSTFREPIPC